VVYLVFLHPKALSYLKKVDKQIQTRIKQSIQELKESPEKGELLLGTEFCKIRAGEYRIIYEIEHKDRKIIILYIGHRKNVYDKFSRML